MSAFGQPTRGGTRGGAAQFSWDQVKQDKHRENYLGHSVKAAVGRWQKGKDLYWYQKDGKQQTDLQKELQMVKEREKQYLSAALGNKDAKLLLGTTVSTKEVSDAVEKINHDDNEVEEHGLGYDNANMVPVNKNGRIQKEAILPGSLGVASPPRKQAETKGQRQARRQKARDEKAAKLARRAARQSGDKYESERGAGGKHRKSP